MPLGKPQQVPGERGQEALAALFRRRPWCANRR